MKTRTLVLAAAIAGLSATLAAQQVRRDGNWEIKMTMDMSGMPNMPAGMSMPAITTTQCITKEMANDPKNTVPQPQTGRGRGAPANCKVEDYKMEGNTATFTMKCEPPQAMTAVGKFTYAADTYNGEMKVDMDRGGQPMSMTMKYTGKRLGDCTK